MTQKTALDFDTLRAANRERARTAEKFAECRTWTTADWMLALTGEMGEAANLLKKMKRGDFTLDQIREDVGRELADVAIYLDLLADHLGIGSRASPSTPSCSCRSLDFFRGKL